MLFLIAIALETALLVYFNLNRWRKSTEKDTKLDSGQAGTGTEYTWNASIYRPITVLGIIGAFAACIVIALFLARNPSTIRDLILACVVSVYAFFVGLVTKSQYMLTQTSLIRTNPHAKKTENEQLFSWDQVLRIQPHNHGFKYFLKDDDPHKGNNKKRKKRLKGFVPIGKRVDKVIDMIISMGIPASQPGAKQSN